MTRRLGTNAWLAYSVRRHALDRDLPAATRGLHGSVLEVGAGRAARRDRFEPPLSRAKRWITLDRRPDGSPHLRGDVQALPFPDHGFDAVLCLEVFEYVADPRRGLRELHRVLAPGGTLVLSTPFLHRVDTGHDLWRFTGPGLRRLLESSGFAVEWIRPQGAALGVAASVLMQAIRVLPRRRRVLLGAALRPLLSALRAADARAARRHPTLATFTTGYLALARTEPAAGGAPASRPSGREG